jgi:hypothetical protein
VSTSLAVIRENGAVAKRRHLSTGEIGGSDEWLGRLHAAWERARSRGLLPRRGAFDPLTVMRFSGGRVHIVDTPSSGPDEYRFRLWGHMIDFDGGLDYTERRVADMPHAAMRLAALEDYLDVVTSGTASYQLIYSFEGGAERTYARLLLPLTPDGRTITHLLVAINQRPIAEFVPRPPPPRQAVLRLVSPAPKPPSAE